MTRLLLVEDDSSIRRFVVMALEDLGLDIVEAPTLAAAHELLRTHPPDIVITDLMLPDGNGIALLEYLAGQSNPPARIAFSAAVGDASRTARLRQLGVSEILDKPVSVTALEDAVARARLSLPMSGDSAAPSAFGPTLSGSPSQPGGVYVDPFAAQSAPPPEPPADEMQARLRAVAEYFEGDAALFRSYQVQCVGQFRGDIDRGNLFVAEGETKALRRLAHNLKSVLLMMGDELGHAQARALEDLAATGDLVAARSLWPRLRERVQRQIDNAS